MAPTVRLKAQWSMILLILFILYAPSHAFWRNLCHGELAQARIDPLMAPGGPSQHLHTIFGASEFGFEPTLDELKASNCTSCSIDKDKSVYWTPQMYFQHDNGTFEIVTKAGGLTAYYFTEVPDVGTNVTAFPDGFRMIAGNSLKRSFYGPTLDPPMSEWQDSDRTQQALMEKSIGFNCLNYQTKYPEGSLEHHWLREKSFYDANCPDGVRAELEFPQCWNGRDLDSANHTTHVQYASRLRNGDCPDGFPIRLPVLFFETIYNTQEFQKFNGRFVLANGDPTGNGYHGDFINGWEGDLLQRAIDNPYCTGINSSGNQWDCPLFTLSPDMGASCQMEIPAVLQHEAINMIETLPGGVQVQGGPGPATMNGMPPHTDLPSTLAISSIPPVTSTEMSAPSASPTSTADPSTTQDAEAPDTTPTPTASPSDSDLTLTYTSEYASDGTSIQLIVIEEILTTTVTVEAATPTAAVRRHLRDHQRHHAVALGYR